MLWDMGLLSEGGNCTHHSGLLKPKLPLENLAGATVETLTDDMLNAVFPYSPKHIWQSWLGLCHDGFSSPTSITEQLNPIGSCWSGRVSDLGSTILCTKRQDPAQSQLSYNLEGRDRKQRDLKLCQVVVLCWTSSSVWDREEHWGDVNIL